MGRRAGTWRAEIQLPGAVASRERRFQYIMPLQVNTHLWRCAVTKALVLTTALLMAGSAAAQDNFSSLPPKADLATLNCKSIFDMNRTSMVMIMAWLQRHYAPRDAAPVLDTEKLMNDSVKLREYCEINPQKTVMEAAGELFGVRL
jgi:hypothetical protein